MPRALTPLVLLQAFPLELGDLLDESLHLLVIAHRLTDPVFPLPGDRKLAQLPLAALDQVEGSVEFAASAMAIGFAAGPAADREGAAQEPGVRDELSQPGSEVAFGGGEASLTFACAVKRRWSTAGNIPPGNWFAPPGSNRSSSGGNEAAEASGVEGRVGDLASL